MGAENFTPQNEIADKMVALNFEANIQKLNELKGKDYPEDFKTNLKEEHPELYERVQSLGDKSSVMELGKAMEELDLALLQFGDAHTGMKVDMSYATEAPGEAAKPKITREIFMEANKDLDLKQFYTLDGNVMKIDFKGNKNAERFVQIQDIMKEPAVNKEMQLEKKDVVYTWDESKTPPSFYNGDNRMLIVSGDEITINNLQTETTENATMRKSLGAKFGVDAAKLTDMKMSTANGEAIATYNYEQNGQNYQLQFNTGKNTVTIMDTNGKVLDTATAGKSKGIEGNIQVAMVIDDMQKEQGVDKNADYVAAIEKQFGINGAHGAVQMNPKEGVEAAFTYKGYNLELSNVTGDTPQKIMRVYDSAHVEQGSALAGDTTNVGKIVDAIIARKEEAAKKPTA